MDVQTSMVFPDRISQQVDAPFGRMAMVATPSGAFIVGPNAVQDLPPGMKDELLRQVRRVPLLLAQKSRRPAARGRGRRNREDRRRLGPDPRRHLRRRLRALVPRPGHLPHPALPHTSVGPQGEAVIVSDYSDYKVVDGYPVAFHLEVATNGQKDQVLALEECKINPGVDAKLFEKPIMPTPFPTPAPTPGAR